MRDGAGPTRVLLVEDNPADVYLIKLLLERVGAALDLDVVSDGESALERLGLTGDSGARFLPELILLDLNLPRLDGWELLRRIKADAKLTVIPVVVLSSAESATEVAHCYRLHASAFVRKLEEPKQMESALRCLSEFWLRTASLPRC